MEEKTNIHLEDREDRQKCLWIATGIIVILAVIHTLTIWFLPFPSWWKIWYLALPFFWLKSHRLLEESVYYDEGIEGVGIVIAVSFIVFTSITLCLLPFYVLVWFLCQDKVKRTVKEFLGLINE